MTNNEAIKLIQGIEEDGRNVTSKHIEALDFALRALRITDSIEAMLISEKSWRNHNCCYWVDGECMCGREHCPDSYDCPDFD